MKVPEDGRGHNIDNNRLGPMSMLMTFQIIDRSSSADCATVVLRTAQWELE